jgi:hypothetical protein
VADQRREARERGVALSVAQHDGQHAELAHRAEREDALEIGFAQRLEAAQGMVKMPSR